MLIKKKGKADKRGVKLNSKNNLISKLLLILIPIMLNIVITVNMIKIFIKPHQILALIILLLVIGFECKNSMVLSLSSFNKIFEPRIAEYKHVNRVMKV